MLSDTVEFRLLQVLVNQVGDERRTVLLVHWDRSVLRLAWNPRPLATAAASGAPDLRAAVVHLVRSLRKDFPSAQPNLPFKAALPLPNLGEVLMWGPVGRGETQVPEAHFERLRAMLGLRTVGDAARDFHGPHRYQLRSILASLGDRMSANPVLSKRVVARRAVESLRSFVSPLSWMNGRWHHCMPVILGDPKLCENDSRLEHALGRIAVSIPRDDIAVVCAGFDDVPDLREEADRVGRFFEHEGRSDVIFHSIPITRGSARLDTLTTRILSDIGASDRPA